MNLPTDLESADALTTIFVRHWQQVLPSASLRCLSVIKVCVILYELRRLYVSPVGSGEQVQVMSTE
jgi:hypothetical protein